MSYELLVMAGEGIGLEVIPQAIRVVEYVNHQCNIDVKSTHYEVGQLSYEQHGCYLPPEAASHCARVRQSKNAAILFGAVTDEPIGILRKDYDLFANIRPIKVMQALQSSCRLKIDNPSDIDLCIVRELTSGVYYGKDYDGVDAQNIRYASQEMYYNEVEVERVARIAFELASTRRQRVTLVHKNNAIKNVFNLWLDVCRKLANKFPDVEFEDIYVDNMAMQMVLRPMDFDVLLCANLFGDILSDLGAGIVGSIGVLSSISQNSHGFALYEGIGGTAPDIAGLQKANPVSAILSVALFYRHTVQMPAIAEAIEMAVNNTLQEFRTQDIEDPQCETMTTSQITSEILKQLEVLL